MFIGAYTTTVKADLEVPVAAAFKENYNVGDRYYVLIDEQRSDTLIYRFDETVHDGERMISSFEVSENKSLKVPFQFADRMLGECRLEGMFSELELSKASESDGADIKKLLEETEQL